MEEIKNESVGTYFIQFWIQERLIQKSSDNGFTTEVKIHIET